jgi:hypothetical protein
MSYYDVDAYKTDHGWVGRATRLDRFGQDELVAYISPLGFETETKEKARRQSARWVLSRGGKIRKTPATRSTA